jgi:acyl carrier protein
MGKEEVAEKVKAIIARMVEGADKGKMTDESRLKEDLNADSLDMIELVMEMEDEFGFSVPDEDAEKIKTVGDAVKYVEEHIT